MLKKYVKKNKNSDFEKTSGNCVQGVVRADQGINLVGVGVGTTDGQKTTASMKRH